MTIGTAPLTVEETWREIDALCAFLGAQGVTEVAVTYGWGCKTDGIMQPVIVPLVELVPLLHKNIAQGIYHLGEDNLYMEAQENIDVQESGAQKPKVKITLCHEADIHVEADLPIEAEVRAQWENRGLNVWPKAKAERS